MCNGNHLKSLIAVIILCGSARATAQEINLWRGDEIKADWNDPYKWKLQHIPTGDEAVHFRQDNSVITVNSTVALDNGMMLYGRNLLLEGHGNINLWNPVPHKSTVNIPASATGYASLTLGDTLALNGHIALAAKAFGTSSSKGSVTLKDRSVITGKLSIGNNGSGSGQVFIEDQAAYRIAELEMNTLAAKGGAAEIHILGGTAHLAGDTHVFALFLADPSRKIIIGEQGTLRVDSDGPVERKNEILSKMISEKRIVAAHGCRLSLPVVQEDMILVKAEFEDTPRPAAVSPVIGIQKVHPPATTAAAESTPHEEAVKPIDSPAAAPAKPSAGSKLAALLNDTDTKALPETLAVNAPETRVENPPDSPVQRRPVPLAGYIVFFSAVLFFMRPMKTDD